MRDFVTAALPWVIMGTALAVLFATREKRRAAEDANYMTEGMCIGMCIGAALGSAKAVDIGLGISLGMLVGEVAGMNMKKDKE